MTLRWKQPEVWCAGTKNNPTNVINTKTEELENTCDQRVWANDNFWCNCCENSLVFIKGWGIIRRKDLDRLVNT